MIISSRLSLVELIELCRVMRHYLGAGLSLPDVFRQQTKDGSARVRAASVRITKRLEHGGSLEDALSKESDVFPPLLLSLASVGELTGMLPEVSGDLEKYYLQQQQLRRSFLSAVSWPVIQFFLATFIIAAIIFMLGIIKNVSPNGGYDPLGFGLSGASGAAIFLGIVFGALLTAFLLFRLAARVLRRNAAFAGLLLSIPAIGPCLRSLALGRFCFALRLTTESAMPIAEALRLSLRATDNEAFVACTPQVQSTVRKGRELTQALTATRLFPSDFLRILAVAEESGKLSDVLKHQAEHYQEESSRRFKTLSSVASAAVRVFVGAAIIIAIFKLYLGYFKMFDSI